MVRMVSGYIGRTLWLAWLGLFVRYGRDSQVVIFAGATTRAGVEMMSVGGRLSRKSEEEREKSVLQVELRSLAGSLMVEGRLEKWREGS